MVIVENGMFAGLARHRWKLSPASTTQQGQGIVGDQAAGRGNQS